jgi:hypothetical protein
MWDIRTMKTLTVDDEKRITLPEAEPGAVFTYEHDHSGRVTLTPVGPAKPKQARLIRRDGRTYLVNDLPITNEDVQRAMENFP